MDEINKVLKSFLSYDRIVTDKSSDSIYKNSNHLSDKSNYYLSHIDEFAEKVLGVKLTHWQKRLLAKLNKQHEQPMIYYPKTVGQQFIRYAWIYSKYILEKETHFILVSNSPNESKRLFNFIKQLSEEAKDEVSVAISTPDTFIKFKNGSTIKIVKPSKELKGKAWKDNKGNV